MVDYTRQPAMPVLIQELRGITEFEKIGDDQYAPTFFKLPCGEQTNRVLIIGTLTEKEDIGTDSEYWRGHLVDPSGSINIYAGVYQPEAAQAMVETETPAYVAVVGKLAMYETESGTKIISVRPESVSVVSDVERDLWIQESAKNTLNRLSAVEASDEKAAYATMVVASLEAI